MAFLYNASCTPLVFLVFSTNVVAACALSLRTLMYAMHDPKMAVLAIEAYVEATY